MAVEIEELIVADEPAAWAAAGFAVDGDACELGGVRIRLAGRDAGPPPLRWTLRGAASTELDGLPTGNWRESSAKPPQVDKAAAGTAPVPLQHPNGATGLDHVVAIAPDLDRTTEALVAAGLDLRRVREEPTPAGAPRQAFFRLGAVILEVVQEPKEAIERGGGPDRPAFFWGLALVAPDLDASVAQLGSELVSGPRDAVQPGRRIATLRREVGLALPVALISPAPPRDAQSSP